MATKNVGQNRHTYIIDNRISTLKSDKVCTKELLLNGNKPPGKVKFGKITVYFYDNNEAE
jgi:hypothetical protein